MDFETVGEENDSRDWHPLQTSPQFSVESSSQPSTRAGLQYSVGALGHGPVRWADQLATPHILDDFQNDELSNVEGRSLKTNPVKTFTDSSFLPSNSSTQSSLKTSVHSSFNNQYLDYLETPVSDILDSSPSQSTSNTGRNRYSCGYCASSFVRPIDRDRHLASVHFKVSTYQCKYPGCSNNRGKGFVREDLLKEHVRKHHKRFPAHIQELDSANSESKNAAESSSKVKKEGCQSEDILAFEKDESPFKKTDSSLSGTSSGDDFKSQNIADLGLFNDNPRGDSAKIANRALANDEESSLRTRSIWNNNWCTGIESVLLSIDSFLSGIAPGGDSAKIANRALANDEEFSLRTRSICNNNWCTGIKSVILSIVTPNTLPEGTQRLEWVCRCGHRSHDVFQEARPGVVAEYAHQLVQTGYIKHAFVTNQASNPLSTLALSLHNVRMAIQNNIYSGRASSLPVTNSGTTMMLDEYSRAHNLRLRQTTIESTERSMAAKYLWLHMCLKDHPYARIPKLQSLQVCKKAEQNVITDRQFFSTLSNKYYSGRSWKDRLSFKLVAVEFAEFTARAAERVDLIVSPKLPPDVIDYEFFPKPPVEKMPPCGPDYMAHLVTCCGSELPPTSVMFVQQVPKKKGSIVTYQPNKYEENIGYGLRFVEKLNTGLAVTVLFLVMLVTSVVFAIIWTILEKDIQGAFGVAAYITAVVTMGTVAWQMWETAI